MIKEFKAISIYIGLHFLIFTPVLSQSYLEGRVFDGTNFEPLSGTLVEMGSTVATTDDYGRFKISYSVGKISFSHLGYHRVEVNAPSPGVFLNVPMQANPLELQEVVVSASLADTRLYAVPSAVSLITKRDLQRESGLVIAPALNRVSGVYMQSGTLNTNRITIRGIGSRSPFSTSKIRAYYDEIPLTTGEGETTIEDLDLSLIERVEILKGPSSSIYGAGLGGTIRLISENPKYRTTALSNQVVVGSFGLRRLVTKIQHSDDRRSLALNYNRTHSNGYRDNNHYDRGSLTALGKLYQPKGHIFSFIANYTDLKAFIPSSLNITTFEENPSAAAANWEQARGFEDYQKGLFGLAFQNKPEDRLEVNAALFGGFRTAFEVRPFNILSEDQKTFGGRVKVGMGSKLAGRDLHWYAGGEGFFDWYAWQTNENQNSIEGALLSDNKERREYLNLFAQADWWWTSKFQITIGANVNRTQYKLNDRFTNDNIDQSGKYSFKTIWSPRLALLYRYAEQGSAFIAINHGFSPPTVAETLTPEGRINPEIQPETGMNYEIGIKHSFLANRLNGEISLYDMKIKNLLVARRVAEDVFVGVNAGKTDHKALETSLQFLISKSKVVNLSAFLSYTLTNYRFDDFIDGASDFSGNQLTGVPRQWATVGLDFTQPQGFYGNLSFQWVDQIPINDANTVFSDAYGLVNFKIGFKRYLLDRLFVDIKAGANNLNNQKYAAMVLVNASGFGGTAPRYYYPGEPRNYYFGVELRYFLKGEEN